jgi:hypothetical protein
MFRPALLAAVYEGDLEKIKRLVAEGADVKYGGGKFSSMQYLLEEQGGSMSDTTAARPGLHVYRYTPSCHYC